MFVGSKIVFVIVTLIRVLSKVEANTGPNYWNTRLGSLIDYARIRPAGRINYPETDNRMQLMESNETRYSITRRNIEKGLVVLIDVCSFGIEVAALATGLSNFAEIEDVDPLGAPYYTRAYRWLLRHFDAFPSFLKGHKGYPSTHQLFDARPKFNRKYIPKWMKTVLFPFISEFKWWKEEKREELFEPKIVYYLREIPTVANATGIGNETHNPYYGIWPITPKGTIQKIIDFGKDRFQDLKNIIG